MSDQYQRKIARIKNYCHKQVTFHSHKNYSPEVYEKVLRKLNFSNYELFDDTGKDYQNLIQKVMLVIDNFALSKYKHINKGSSQDWFDAEIMEKILEKDKVIQRIQKIMLACC